MVFTVEPGLYVPISAAPDTRTRSSCTKEGIEILTYCPRDLKSMIIPV